MNTYIALFRGINVGGKNLLPMKELAAILEAMRYENIQTYIQSGNVVFRSKMTIGDISAAEISRQILEKKGFEPRVLLLKAQQLRDAIEGIPFPSSDGKALHFYFLDSQPDQPDMEWLMSVKAESEEFRLGNRVFYLYAPDGIGRSKLAAMVERAMGVPATARNWNTVNKLSYLVEMV